MARKLLLRPVTMNIAQGAGAAVFLVLVGVVAASCSLATEPPSATQEAANNPVDSVGADNEEPTGLESARTLPSEDSTDPTGEVKQPIWPFVPQTYESKEFPFAPSKVKDDREGFGAGWLVAYHTSGFTAGRGLLHAYRWECHWEFGMPLRSELEGTITPSRAALITANVATAVVFPLLAQ
jgi:hypothetical protein